MGIDNLMRPGSETNRARLRELGVEFIHGDIAIGRAISKRLPACGLGDRRRGQSQRAGGRPGGGSSRQLFEHNLAGVVQRAGILQGAQGRAVAAEQQPRVLDSGAGRAFRLRDGDRRFRWIDPAAPLPAGSRP